MDSLLYEISQAELNTGACQGDSCYNKNYHCCKRDWHGSKADKKQGCLTVVSDSAAIA